MPSSSHTLVFGGTVVPPSSSVFSPVYYRSPHTRLFVNSSVSGMDASTWTMWYYSTNPILPGDGASIDYLMYNVRNSSAAGVSSDCFSDTSAPAVVNKTGSIVGGVIGGLAALAILIGIIAFRWKRERHRELSVAWWGTQRAPQRGGVVGVMNHQTWGHPSSRTGSPDDHTATLLSANEPGPTVSSSLARMEEGVSFGRFAFSDKSLFASLLGIHTRYHLHSRGPSHCSYRQQQQQQQQQKWEQDLQEKGQQPRLGPPPHADRRHLSEGTAGIQDIPFTSSNSSSRKKRRGGGRERRGEASSTPAGAAGPAYYMSALNRGDSIYTNEDLNGVLTRPKPPSYTET